MSGELAYLKDVKRVLDEYEEADDDQQNKTQFVEEEMATAVKREEKIRRKLELDARARRARELAAQRVAVANAARANLDRLRGLANDESTRKAYGQIRRPPRRAWDASQPAYNEVAWKPMPASQQTANSNALLKRAMSEKATSSKSLPEQWEFDQVRSATRLAFSGGVSSATFATPHRAPPSMSPQRTPPHRAPPSMGHSGSNEQFLTYAAGRLVGSASDAPAAAQPEASHEPAAAPAAAVPKRPAPGVAARHRNAPLWRAPAHRLPPRLLPEKQAPIIAPAAIMRHNKPWNGDVRVGLPVSRMHGTGGKRGWFPGDDL